jgi:L-malate glycosyltransferase
MFKMKIAFVVTSLANVGPVIVVKDLIEALPPEVEVSVFHLDDIVAITLPSRVTVRNVGFFERVDLSKFDLVHSHMMRADMFCAMRRRNIKKLVTTMHSDFKLDLRISHGRFVGGLASIAWYMSLLVFDKCVFLTNVQRQRYPLLRKACVVYNGRPAPAGEAAPRAAVATKAQIMLGTCAHVVRRKGLSQVIDLLAIDKEERYHFQVVGDGPELASLKEYANTKGVSHKCSFLGRQSDVYKYISRFDVYVMTSHSEGMPLALIEAAAANAPIVCSRLPVIEEVFSGDEISYYALEDIEGLRSAVELCVSRADRQAERAFERYRRNYTPRAMAANYLNVFAELGVATGQPSPAGSHLKGEFS